MARHRHTGETTNEILVDIRNLLERMVELMERQALPAVHERSGEGGDGPTTPPPEGDPPPPGNG